MAALVLGTFLPFHQGHESLIDFARSMGGGALVMISSRSKEPIPGELRASAIQSRFPNTSVYHHKDDNAPQSPKSESDVDFWNYWKAQVNKAEEQSGEHITCVVSSEDYGDKMAEVLGVQHYRFDQGRGVVKASGTLIREDPITNYIHLNIEMAKRLRTKYVLFGAESVGKSTMTSALSKLLGNSFASCHEWARPFLESQEDKSPSLQNMKRIFQGQVALEYAASSLNSPQVGVVMDTDIMSTFGYAELVGMSTEPYCHLLPQDRRKYYILSQEGVPFEPDVLRYGDGVRETQDSYWMDLLERNNIAYKHVTGTYVERLNFIYNDILTDVRSKFSFERD